MSTLHNRRRGAKANKPRTPRRCAAEWVESMPFDPNGAGRDVHCPRIAERSRYCEKHRGGAAT